MSNSLILDSLEIRNFRVFRYLRIERLSRVNLFVGENSIGKTSLLEALWLYAQRGAPSILWQILRARHESEALLSERSESVLNPEEQLQVLRTLFYGRKEITLSSIPSPIEIRSLAHDDALLEIGIEWYQEEIGTRKLVLAEKSIENSRAHEFSVPFAALITQVGGKTKLIYRLDTADNKLLGGKVSPIHNVFVSADGLSSSQINDFWENIVLTDLEDQVTEALRIITQGVVRVNLTSGRNGSKQRIPKARISGSNSPIPIRTLGEGMNRLFGIALALVNAKDGLLFIDEIESGLYHFVLPDVWRLIFKLAKVLNVQVFATSHSWDCLEAFAKATRENEQEEGLLISLREHQKEEGTVAAVLFDEEEVDFVSSERIEVR